MQFEEFQKIPRLMREIIITEKIDGTNAQIYVPEDDGPVLAGSRSRWITVDDDNFGFAAWVYARADSLRSALGPGRHFGEWWGAGIQRKYGQTQKRFSLFNTARWGGVELPHGITAVPVIYQGPMSMDDIDAAMAVLELNGSVAAPGFMDPEGIVVFHTAANHCFKRTIKRDEEHKGKGAR